MIILTVQQKKALKNVYARIRKNMQPGDAPTYLAFRRQVVPGLGGDYILVPYCGIWLGIEPDGYTHS